MSDATVLVVDDSPENRYVARRYLARAGFEIWEAETGAEGLRRAQDDPDLILLDVHLPDIDGFEVCRRLKQDPVTARIPILQRSQSHIDDAARVHGLESGADAYLAEPIAPSVLVATARALLRMRRAETRLRREIAHAEMVNRVSDAFASLLSRDEVVAALAAHARTELAARSVEVRLEEPGGEPRFDERSASVPLVAYGRALGRVELAFDGPPPDHALVLSLAEQAAQALERAGLYEHQRHIATTLQAGLLPRRLPSIPGAEIATRYNAGAQAMDVGGDFYDVFARGDDWVLVIGDVCGRGAEAAALTSLARHTIRAQAQHHAAPSAILRALHEAVVAESGDDTRFLTAGCVVLRGEHVVAALGGHPPALLLRADGTVDELPTTGSLLGLPETTGVDDVEGRLGAGDALILYTDGVNEARRGRSLFGEDRLRSVVSGLAGAPAEAIAGGIRDAAVAFAGSADDDLAVLVVRQLS
jgi:serine phosphatase RsbU (regulator of sigma subunit)/DNA-binding response OmpR family regulator